jgi:archaemetzincin
MRPEIDLIPMDDVDESVIEALRLSLKDKNCIVRVYAKIHSPKTAINMYRKQYDAEIILDALKDLDGSIIAITDKDIYTEKLNFVFSRVRKKGPAIISTYRLNPEFYQERKNFDKLVARLFKEAIYCIGKVSGLNDCPHPKCIMHKSTSAREIDMKDAEFCKECKLNNIIDCLA